jgi:hypothetical protein
LEDIAINGRIEIHNERRVLGFKDCVLLVLSRDQRWVVVLTLFKLSMTEMLVISYQVVPS